MDHMSSLNVEMVVDFLPYQRKNIMDQMSVLKVKIDVLNELIETEKSASKMVEDKISLIREQLLATTSNKWSQKYAASRTAHQEIRKANSTTVQKHTAMCIEYSAPQKHLALA